MDIIKKVKSLDLPEGEYLVFGSGPMGIREIRGVGDIDLLISFNLYQRLEKRGWREKTRESSGGKYLVYESVEATQDWICGDYYPSLERLLKTMDVFDGVPFASLEEVIRYKEILGREKDKRDIELIRAYLGGGEEPGTKTKLPRWK